MRSRRFKFGVIFLLVSLTACNNTPSEIGAGFLSDQVFDVSSIDTVLLRTSTIMYDSLATSYSGRLLVGHHNDPKLGEITSYPAFQVNVPFLPRLDIDYTTYTSFSLHLLPDGYSYYDTTQAITLKVYRLTKKLDLYNGYRFNVDKFQIDSTAEPLGSITFTPQPQRKDSVDIPLSADLGHQLFDMAQSKTDVILNSFFDFEQLFHGLVLVPDTLSSGTLMGFKPNASMRLYYHDKSVFPTKNPDRYLSFAMNTGTAYYNKIEGDRSATKLAGLTNSTQIINSSLTDHEVYIQGGAGLAMRIELPYIKNLLYLQSNFRTTRAILNFVPVDGYLQSLQYLPPSLTVDLVDGNNQTLQVNIATAALIKDRFENASYQLDLTNFINSQILSAKNNNALLLRLKDADYRASVASLAVGDASNSFNMKLTVYFITLQDK